jgi:hypothetical protein
MLDFVEEPLNAVACAVQAARDLTLQQIRRLTERATELATARVTEIVAEVAGALNVQKRAKR